MNEVSGWIMLIELFFTIIYNDVIRCNRDLDGCSWHHGFAYITPEDYNFTTGPHVLELFAENIVQVRA